MRGAQQSPLAREIDAPQEAHAGAEAGFDLLGEMIYMRLIRVDLAGNQQRHAGDLGGIDRQVKAFFRTDPAHR